jgi:hypothetical protein
LLSSQSMRLTTCLYLCCLTQTCFLVHFQQCFRCTVSSHGAAESLAASFSTNCRCFHCCAVKNNVYNTGCFKKSFTTLKAYRNLYRGHTQRFELSKCSKTHRVLPRIVIRNCFDLFFRFFLHGTSTVTIHRPGKWVLRYSRTSPR